jgi:hypothetical protein
MIAHISAQIDALVIARDALQKAMGLEEHQNRQQLQPPLESGPNSKRSKAMKKVWDRRKRAEREEQPVS